jgi:hypothetical protein
MKVQIVHSGTTDRVTHISSQIDRDLNKMDVAKVSIIREDIDFDVTKFDDELLLRRDDGTLRFGGVITQENRNKGLIEFVAESYERYAVDTKPLPSSLPFESESDTNIIQDVISRVSEIDIEQINTVENSLDLNFHNVSPGKAIRKIREITGGEIKYTNRRKLIYKNEIGSNKTGTTLSPRNKNVSSINVSNWGKEEKITHIRMLGAGSGSQQVTAEVIADEYDPGVDKERWITKIDKSIDDSNMLRKKGKQIINEKYETRSDITVTVRSQVDVDLGDKFTINYPEEHVNNRAVRAVRIKEKYDNNGERYDVTFSNIEKQRETQREGVQRNLREMAVEEENEIFGLPQYEDPNNAGTETGVVYVTGDNPSYTRGIYTYDPEDSQWEMGSNQDLNDLRNLIIENRDLKYGNGDDDILFDASENVVPIDAIQTFALEHGEEIDAPPNAHHPTPDTSVGYVISDPDRANGYNEFINTGFRPQYVEFHSTFNKATPGNTYEEDEDELEQFITTGHSYGVGHGNNGDEQVVNMTTTSPGYPRGNKSYVNNGKIVYFEKERYDGGGIYTTEYVEAKFFSKSNNGFKITWPENDFKLSVVYKAFR